MRMRILSILKHLAYEFLRDAQDWARDDLACRGEWCPCLNGRLGRLSEVLIRILESLELDFKRGRGCDRNGDPWGKLPKFP